MRKLRTPSVVVWRDAYALDETWIAKDHKFAKPVIVTTVGYIINDIGPKGYTTIADSTYVNGGERFYGGITVIPDGMVVSVDPWSASG